ncbi:MAG: thioredoxin family protein [Owenweeksia sp.]|nr:thioredoxin family protein [Owenweeksia sp.]
MKKLFLLLMLAFISIANAQDEKIEWMSIEEAIEASKEEPRKLIIDVYTDWCGWCKRMDQTTFSTL